MHLWLLCCVLLFVVAQGYDWVSHHWAWGMPTLGLPWLVLGGIGLAIASNRSFLQSSAALGGPPEVSPTGPVSSAAIASQSPLPETKPPAIAPEPHRQSRKGPISFKISPKVRSTPQ